METGKLTFNPNRLKFEDGLVRIANANSKMQFDPDQKIVTSKDPVSIELKALLMSRNVPDGFQKWQLPFALDRAQMFISIGAPNSVVPLHSHDEGAGVRFIISGTIHYKGAELGAGDWMYIPQAKKYEFTVGSEGVMMAYCYSCCCVE